ncbi:hypothetical protein [Actinophytocola xanthii]|uniref:Uncharacterized protein n=1 Tax=Actinophytocola xanthii TaxID=1912961 RepID=A0A1Q8CPA9_9PSEU|nr:hypothetical protein [Actinophytocola xanthii]OLF16199.1 hypothetical protein BU204_17650 [Actinophytocola xanthii]
MDVKTYATVVELCARFAGRLPDDVLDAVRSHYFGGEELIAESALLLGLAYDGVAITREEKELIRSVLDDPDNPDLDDIAVVEELPPPAYRFSPTGPADVPVPTRADAVLSEEAPRHGGRRLRRTWREPTGPDAAGGTWLYVLQVAPGSDELRAYSALSSRLWVVLHEKWQVEVVTEGSLLPPYQAAALTAAHQVWPL